MDDGRAVYASRAFLVGRVFLPSALIKDRLNLSHPFRPFFASPEMRFHADPRAAHSRTHARAHTLLRQSSKALDRKESFPSGREIFAFPLFGRGKNTSQTFPKSSSPKLFNAKAKRFEDKRWEKRMQSTSLNASPPGNREPDTFAEMTKIPAAQGVKASFTLNFPSIQH